MAGSRRMDAPGNLRVGYPTRGNRSGHLYSDDAASALPKAVVAYATRDNKVLAVTRGMNGADFNLPGGLVEPGEDPHDAAVRELWEETGIKADELFPVMSKVNDGHLVTVYRVTSYHGELKSSREGIASWQPPKTISNGTFGDFFKQVQDVIGSVTHR